MHTITTYWGRKPVHITNVIIGDVYEFQPANPAATRNRGRRGILIEYDTNQYRTDLSKNATVKWLDTKRTSQVDIGSFIHISDTSKTKEQLAKEASEYLKKRAIEDMDQPLTDLIEPIEFEYENKTHWLKSAGKTNGEPIFGIKYPNEPTIQIVKFANLPIQIKTILIDIDPTFFRTLKSI